MKKITTWVLVADGARARILRNLGPGNGIDREIVKDFEGSTALSRDIASDRPGRTFDSAGSGRHAMAPPSDPHDHEQVNFLREVVAYIEKASEKKSFDRLVIVAPPTALGTLRARLSRPLSAKVTGELNKDLTKVPVHDLAKHLGGVMAV
jgi:protein required for attachment to host cells